MMSLHASDISVMRKQAGCGGLGWESVYPAVMTDERAGEKDTQPICVYSVHCKSFTGSRGGEKLGDAHGEN